MKETKLPFYGILPGQDTRFCMRAIHFQRAWAYALLRLQNELLPELTYHSYRHTLYEVVASVERLARQEGVTACERQFLITAACFHDLGFTQVREVTPEEYDKRFIHEENGAIFASQALPEFGFNPEQIALVQRLVLATRFPSNPQDHLESIICDADLSSVGLPTPDFLRSSLTLRTELAAFGMKFSDHNWWQRQVNFLQDHRFYTISAQRSLGSQKNRNLEELLRLVNETAS